MNTVYTVARVLMGLMFIIFGFNGFVPFIPNPPSIPQYAGMFFGAMVQSHFAWFVFGVQLISGILLIVNRYVTLALVLLAGVIANILAFHITMWPASLVPMPLLATVLWFIVAWRNREKLYPILRPAAFVAAFALGITAFTASPAAAATQWSVIVGGETPDVSVYANGFFPQELTIHTGDTVTWQFDGYHNVTFLSGQPAPTFATKDGERYYGNPQVFFPAGSSTYDGTGFHNSGLPPSDKPFTYSITFTKAGRYEYACTLHPGMAGVINVTDGAVSETPKTALARGKAEQAASIAAGSKAYGNLKPQRNGDHVVVRLLGDKQARFSLLRYTHDPLTIAAGTTVTWTVDDPYEVHTITFAGDTKLPELILPQPQAGGAPKLLLNPIALTPTSTTTYDGTGWANSGLIGGPGAPGNPPSSFSLQFTKPGRYVYWCLVHDHEDQQGTIIVK